jgi:hypothetical protein
MRMGAPIGLLFALAVAVAGLVGVTGASAAPPTTASGTVGNTWAVFNSVRPAGQNLIVDLTATAAYTGTFEGTSVINGILIIHADGSASFHDVEVFTGTVNGVPGTVTFKLNGSNDAAGAVHATATIISAGGELAGLHGVLHETQTITPFGPVGTYTGNLG